MAQPLELRHPFGENSCEEEIQILGERYKEYYFDHVPFNNRAMDVDTYIIVGRRGSGKTSLGHYFSFQKQLRDSTCIDVDEPKVFQHVLRSIAKSAAETEDVAVPRIVNVWEFVIWSLLFQEYHHSDAVIAAASALGEERLTPSRTILRILKNLLAKLIKDDKGDLVDDVESLLCIGPK